MLIWFGAGVSITEILTGTYLAPLGMGKGIAAIVSGHFIGCALLFLAGRIGARTGRSSMETVKMGFGRKGGLLLAAPYLIWQLPSFYAFYTGEFAILAKRKTKM